MKIRPATKDDLDSCEKILSIPELKFASGESPSKKYLGAYLDEKLFLVCEVGKEVIACIFGELLKDRGAMLWYLAVDETFRGKGIGNELLKRFERNCKEKGTKWIVLYSPQKSPASIKFYESRGYMKGKAFHEMVHELS